MRRFFKSSVKISLILNNVIHLFYFFSRVMTIDKNEMHKVLIRIFIIFLVDQFYYLKYDFS